MSLNEYVYAVVGIIIVVAAVGWYVRSRRGTGTGGGEHFLSGGADRE